MVQREKRGLWNPFLFSFSFFSSRSIHLDFREKVAEGREPIATAAEVDSIGQGRVWSGTDAIEIGLVDEMGGLKAALDYAAEQEKVLGDGAIK